MTEHILTRKNDHLGDKLLEYAYLTGLGTYLLFLLQSTTTFFLPLPVQTEKYLLIFLTGLTGVLLPEGG